MTHWWEIATADQAGKPVRSPAVAYYRHSAQDRQENSNPIQREQVREWAEKNGVKIVREFADTGKSSLTADGQTMTKSIRPRAIGYVRTAAENPTDIERQAREIREYCDRQAIVLVEMVTACGESGTQSFDERGGRTIKEIVLRDAVDMLIVTDVTRLSRDAEDLARTVDWLDEHGVGICLVSNGSYYCPGF